MRSIAVALVAATLGCWGCGGGVTAPDTMPSQAAEVDRVTIRGQIYTSVGPEYPAIQNARIEVNEADGTNAIVTSIRDGSYLISVRRGSITITASKEGYEAKQWQFDLLSDLVLNFSLDPQ